MAEKDSNTMLSSLMGEQGQETLQMLTRMERLKKLMGTQRQTAPMTVPQEKPTALCGRSRKEDMIAAAIPFLDPAYQRGIYVMVRLMEMQRVLADDFLETREKQRESPALRRQKLLRAIQPYMGEGEQKQMETMLKVMAMQELMGGKNQA